MYRYSTKDIREEVREVIDGLMLQKIVIDPDEVTAIVLQSHVAPEDEFFVYCGYESTRREVRAQISRFKLDLESVQDKQFVLPGFEHLQEYYLIAREGEQRAVPIHDMTVFELTAKQKELIEMGNGCFKHADEIGFYLKSKKVA